MHYVLSQFVILTNSMDKSLKSGYFYFDSFVCCKQCRRKFLLTLSAPGMALRTAPSFLPG